MFSARPKGGGVWPTLRQIGRLPASVSRSLYKRQPGLCNGPGLLKSGSLTAIRVWIAWTTQQRSGMNVPNAVVLLAARGQMEAEGAASVARSSTQLALRPFWPRQHCCSGHS
jgi:hypothetical protein